MRKIILMVAVIFTASIFCYADSCKDSGLEKEYKADEENCTYQTRTCCKDGTWSDWDGECDKHEGQCFNGTSWIAKPEEGKVLEEDPKDFHRDFTGTMGSGSSEYTTSFYYTGKYKLSNCKCVKDEGWTCDKQQLEIYTGGNGAIHVGDEKMNMNIPYGVGGCNLSISKFLAIENASKEYPPLSMNHLSGASLNKFCFEEGQARGAFSNEWGEDPIGPGGGWICGYNNENKKTCKYQGKELFCGRYVSCSAERKLVLYSVNGAGEVSKK